MKRRSSGDATLNQEGVKQSVETMACQLRSDRFNRVSLETYVCSKSHGLNYVKTMPQQIQLLYDARIEENENNCWVL